MNRSQKRKMWNNSKKTGKNPGGAFGGKKINERVKLDWNGFQKMLMGVGGNEGKK